MTQAPRIRWGVAWRVVKGCAWYVAQRLTPGLQGRLAQREGRRADASGFCPIACKAGNVADLATAPFQGNRMFTQALKLSRSERR